MAVLLVEVHQIDENHREQGRKCCGLRAFIDLARADIHPQVWDELIWID